MPVPERTYRTEAVIIRRRNLGETDRILTLYSREHGKIRAIGKGIRRPTSKNAGHLELFMRADLLISRGRDLDIISQAESLDVFLPLRQNLELGSYAGHFAELVDAFTEDDDEQRELYYLLTTGLNWLTSTTDPARTSRYYELHLLRVVGYRPDLFHCVVCGEELKPQNQFYSAEEGGVICPNCGNNHPRTYPISLQALKVLRHLGRSPFEAVEQLSLSAAVHRELEYLIHTTIRYHLERRLKSAEFLKRLRRETEKRGTQPG